MYKRIKPTAALADIVESIWIQDSRKPATPRLPSRVVPTGTVEILFQYGDPVMHLEPAGRMTMPRSYMTGQRTRPVLVLGSGRVGIVIVSLFPWGLRTLFPGGVEAVDGYVGLELLDRREPVVNLEERLALAVDARERVRLIQNYLLRRRSLTIDDGMVTATKLLAQPTWDHPLRRTASTLSISQRHLSRRFKSAIGLSPGVFSRVMRFQQALRLRRTYAMPWASIAAACGYSDQAHMIHEMRTFAGQSPGQIRLLANTADAIFNGDGASSFFDTVYI